MRQEGRSWSAYLVVALIAFAAALALWLKREQPPLLDRLMLDAQTQWRGPLAPGKEQPLLLVSIDDTSLQRLGTFSPDRRLYAQAIDKLAAGGASVIALDILFLEAARPDPASDTELARAMRAAGNVVIPFVMRADGQPAAAIPDSVLDSSYLRTSGDPKLPFHSTRMATPIEVLAQSAKALGHVSSQPNADGAMRFDLPGLSLDGEAYPSMALRMAAMAAGAEWKKVQMQFREQVQLNDKVRVPLDAFSRQWINYYGPAGTIDTVLFTDLLDGKVAPERLKGRVALIGVSALGAGDHLPTPFTGRLPGMERLATVVDNILTNRVLARPAWASAAEIAAMLCLPLLAVGVIGTWRPRRAVLGLAVLGLLLLLGLQYLFERQVLLSPAFPMLAFGLAVLGATSLRAGAEQARKREALIALSASEERYALALQGANDGMWDWDIVQDKVYFSARWLALMSLDANQAGSMAAWTSQLDPAGRKAFEDALAAHLSGRSQQFHHVLNFKQGGNERWLLARGVATRELDKEQGRAVRMAGSLTDISEQQQLQRQITFDALHDRLTGLPNRTLFLERLTQTFNANPQDTGVVLADLDGFRALNEREGTQVADAVLLELSRRLSARDGQPTNVARIGSDRFAVLFAAPLKFGGVDEQRLAAWVLSQCQMPFQIGTHELIEIGGSVGWAHVAHGPAAPEELLNAAEMALAQAKAHRRGQVHVYDPAEQLVENSRRWLHENITLGLQRDEFRLHYQPLVKLEDKSLLGFEALIRWPHPTKGMVMPGDFIPYAEESGQIVQMGRWTMLEAARQLVAWDALGFKGEIAVNLSGKQFSEGDLESDARAVLKILGTVPAKRMKLEVTESMAMSNPEVTAMALQGLATLGFKISIDDFGTGYSSLAYLHRFPFDTLKIDRSFVMRLASGREAVEIVRTIVGLALALDKQVLAEGVEEESQAKLLRELGVHVGQGWLFSKALPAEDAKALILLGGPVGKPPKK